MGLQGYRRDGNCEYLVYKRGAFSTAGSGSNCNIFQETPRPFDAEARRDFLALTNDLSSADVAVDVIADVQYRVDGAVATARFDFGDNAFVGQSYFYELGAARGDSELGGAIYTQIDQNWYMVVDPVR